jgi:hypothetical protein
MLCTPSPHPPPLLFVPLSWRDWQEGARTQDVIDLVSEIPGSKVLSDVGAELSFQLPLQESGRFPTVLAKVWVVLGVGVAVEGRGCGCGCGAWGVCGCGCGRGGAWVWVWVWAWRGVGVGVCVEGRGRWRGRGRVCVCD